LIILDAMTLTEADVARRRTVMLRNVSKLSSRVPAALEKEQRGLTREVQRRQYADNDVKALVLLYDYVDRVMALAKGTVACKHGCSACCHGEVALFQPEADLIAAKTGRPAKTLAQERRQGTPYTMTTVPCPFLKNDACSIYAHRPMVCRTLVHFDTDNTLCQFEHRHNVTVPMIDRASTFAGVYEAYGVILARRVGGAGDIREFFGDSLD